MSYRYFTAESVTEGHPDKLCDQISDAVLDDLLRQDPLSRVACECSAARGMVLVAGEITTKGFADIAGIAREVIADIGYTRGKFGFDADTCAIITAIDAQSPDIARGVDHAFEDALDTGAGDQGMMFGYACDETPQHMPAALMYAHALCRRLAQVRRDGTLKYLRPDGKAQVTLAYHPDGSISHIAAVVVSSQHNPDLEMGTLRRDLRMYVIRKVLPAEWLREDTQIYINPTGRFVHGGPRADCGLTGRKIIVDTYGGAAHHGGGAFSGKDPTKVDRSAAYACRQVARNVVAAGLAKRCEVSVAYAIGVAHPLQISVDSFGTGVLPDAALSEAVRRAIDMRPAAIIERLDLRRPLYRPVAAYGHFGRDDLNLPWEQLNLVEDIKKYV